MHKILALSPKSLNLYQDWLKFFDKLGQPNGIFFANFPNPWIPSFLEHLEALDLSEWDDWDKKRVVEYFNYLKNNKCLVPMNQKFDYESSWELNYTHLPDEKKRDCIAIGERKNSFGIKDFRSLNPLELKAPSHYAGSLSPNELVNLLAIYFLQTKKIAFVDRHNYLLDSMDRPSRFANFIQSILKLTSTVELGEVLIYAQFDQKYAYMRSEGSLREALFRCFSDFKLPLYGIKYMCCEEVRDDPSIANLHTRLICTNHAVFQLGDSIPGRNNSQLITRIPDSYESSSNLTYWIDGDHNLKVITEATLLSDRKIQQTASIN